MKVGDKIKFNGEKQRYTLQARNDRFLIFTKPFNARKTVIYSIVDLERKERGPDNLVFSHGHETKEQCEYNLKLLSENKMEVSYRRCKELEPEELQSLKQTKD